MVQRQDCLSPTGQIQDGFIEEVVSEPGLQGWVCFSEGARKGHLRSVNNKSKGTKGEAQMRAGHQRGY